jgi:hypothetical protein
MSTDKTFLNFVGLSSILTGYPPATLAPTLDPVNVVTDYLNTMLQKADSQMFLQTLSVYEPINLQFPLSPSGQVPQDPNNPKGPKIPDPNRQQQATLVEQNILSDPDMGNIARRIIRLWYLSTWYTEEPPPPFADGEVVSMNAYTRGLAWDAFLAHPMGYSEEAFGYWATAPANASTAPGAGVAPEVIAPAEKVVAEEESAPMTGGRQRGGI